MTPPSAREGRPSFVKKPYRNRLTPSCLRFGPVSWLQSVIPGATLYAYTKAEQGDHFLMFKNPIKFTNDLQAFRER